MKKQLLLMICKAWKTLNTLFLIGLVGVFVVGCNQTNFPNEEMSMESDTTISETEEISEAPEELETTEEGTEISIEQNENDEEIELRNDTIYYLKDEAVNAVVEYSDFLEGKITAYNNNLQKEQYFKEYYRDYVINQFGYIYGLQITSADLNGDEQQELLVIFMSHSDEGDLLVFENRDGKLYAWDIMENFFTMRVGSVYLRKDGTFEFFGGYGQGHFFKRYNEQGKVETVLDYYYYCTVLEDGDQFDYRLTQYEDGEVIKTIEYSIFAKGQDDPDKGELIKGTQEDKDECERILDEYFAQSERVREFHFVQYEDNVQEVPADFFL